MEKRAQKWAKAAYFWNGKFKGMSTEQKGAFRGFRVVSKTARNFEVAMVITAGRGVVINVNDK